MDFNQVNLQIDAYKSHNQILEAAEYIIRSFHLDNDNLEGFGLRDDEKPNYVVVTTEGNFRELQKIMIPKNLFDFDLNLVLNLLAHEMLHVRQKTEEPVVEDKNEREWQAYYEMLFHKNFPQIPDAEDFNRKQFAEKAFEYYKRMGEGSELQLKYADEKKRVEEVYDEILIKRGEK
jgi:hypothetical protein